MTTINYNSAGGEIIPGSTIFQGGKSAYYRGGNNNYAGSSQSYYSVLDDQTGTGSAADVHTFGDYATLFSEESDGTVDVFVPQQDMLISIQASIDAYATSSNVDLAARIDVSYDSSGTGSYTLVRDIKYRSRCTNNNKAIGFSTIFPVVADSYVRARYYLYWNTATPRQVDISYSIACVQLL